MWKSFALRYTPAIVLYGVTEPPEEGILSILKNLIFFAAIPVVLIVILIISRECNITFMSFDSLNIKNFIAYYHDKNMNLIDES